MGSGNCGWAVPIGDKWGEYFTGVQMAKIAAYPVLPLLIDTSATLGVA